MNLSVNFLGKIFKNPIIAASGTFGFGREYAQFYDISALGGICTKGLTLKPRLGNNPPRIAEASGGMINSVGLQNPGIEAFLRDEMPFLKKLDTVIIANVAGSSIDEYVEIAALLNNSGVDMIELNVSCPNVKEGCASIGVRADLITKLSERVKNVFNNPVIVKLTPLVSDITQMAAAAKQGGADAVSLINTIPAMAIDFKTRRPILANITGGLSGPAIKPVALKMVYNCFKTVDIPLIGMGGIMNGGDIMEFMIAGAKLVQVGSANIFDPNACINILNDLTNLLKDCKISDINEIIGEMEV